MTVSCRSLSSSVPPLSLRHPIPLPLFSSLSHPRLLAHGQVLSLSLSPSSSLPLPLLPSSLPSSLLLPPSSSLPQVQQLQRDLNLANQTHPHPPPPPPPSSLALPSSAPSEQVQTFSPVCFPRSLSLSLSGLKEMADG
eukprot:3090997-Rhodomonas_salina.1